MAELEKAGAVVVIWSEGSVKSDWVRAEAGRARQGEKLVPVKTRSVAHDDIPLPFSEMHTELITNEGAVLAAVEKVLRSPRQGPAFWKVARYHLWSWIGIVGTAITLAANLRGLMDVARWVRLLFDNWAYIMHAAWKHILFFLPSIGKADAGLLTFASLLSA